MSCYAQKRIYNQAGKPVFSLDQGLTSLITRREAQESHETQLAAALLPEEELEQVRKQSTVGLEVS